jgi:hypothetical protein
MIKKVLVGFNKVMQIISTTTTVIYLGWFIVYAAEDRSIIEILSNIPPAINIAGGISILVGAITWSIDAYLYEVSEERLKSR